MIRDSYFKSKADNDILLPRTLNDSNKASFVVERVYNDNRKPRETLDTSKPNELVSKSKQASFVDNDMLASPSMDPRPKGPKDKSP